MEEASELEFLEWFFCECDFGPAHCDVMVDLMESFEETKGKCVPRNYREGYLG